MMRKSIALTAVLALMLSASLVQAAKGDKSVSLQGGIYLPTGDEKDVVKKSLLAICRTIERGGSCTFRSCSRCPQRAPSSKPAGDRLIPIAHGGANTPTKPCSPSAATTSQTMVNERGGQQSPVRSATSSATTATSSFASI